MGQDEYIQLRRNAIRFNPVGDYDIHIGESNPALFKEFVWRILEEGMIPNVIWEPFAGHTGKSKNCDIATHMGAKLIAFDIAPCDSRVYKQDSTVTGPRENIGGLFFHPPYFGTVPLSKDIRDLSMIGHWNGHMEALQNTVSLANQMMVNGGIVCAICRDYRHRGERIRLDLEYIKLFESNSFVLYSVWASEPDVALIFRKAI